MHNIKSMRDTKTKNRYTTWQRQKSFILERRENISGQVNQLLGSVRQVSESVLSTAAAGAAKSRQMQLRFVVAGQRHDVMNSLD